jgi:hypothetical protein
MAAVGCSVCVHRKTCTIKDSGGFGFAAGGSAPYLANLPRPMPCGGSLYERDVALPPPAEWRRDQPAVPVPSRRPVRPDDGLGRPGWTAGGGS